MRPNALTLPLVCLTSLGIGCHGPLPVPMVQRLGDEEQLEVDESWENMFAPVGRLDRSLLLDAIMAYELHTRGVDRLHMTSEKFIEGAVVVLEVIFDRDEPESDAFIVTLIGDDGYESPPRGVFRRGGAPATQRSFRLQS